jgi:hypothetical protein
MKEYMKKLRDVITFFVIWFGIPHLMVVYTQHEELYAWIIIMWLPAVCITGYLKDEENDN